MEETYIDSKPQTVHDANGSLLIPQTLFPEDRWKTEDYDLKGCKHPGKFIVFNHYSFNKDLDLSKRKGTAVDARRVKTTLEKLGFKEADKCQEDLTFDEITEKITEMAQASFDEYGCIVIVILTHGELGKLYAKDKEYEVSLLWDILTGDKIARKLAGKPKLFLIQACQGEIADDGITHVDARPLETNKEKKIFRIPLFADFLITFSSSPGYLSFRQETGSWFIQSLCDAIDQFKDHMDFESILTLMKYDVARNKESYSPKMDQYHNKKQIPVVSSTLTKKLYLTAAAANKEKKPIQLTLLHPAVLKYTNESEGESDVDSRPMKKEQTRKRSTANNKGQTSDSLPMDKVASIDPRSTDVISFSPGNELGYTLSVIATFFVTCFIFWLLRSDYNIHCYPPK